MKRVNRSLIGMLGVTLIVLGIGFLAWPASVFAGSEGVTCGWCGEYTDDFGTTIHGFFNGGDECGWPAPSGGPGSVECSRCGGTSSCHTEAQSGGCHLQCGGDENLTINREIQDALGNKDARALLAALGKSNDKYAVEYSPVAGRIEVINSCDRTRPANTYPVAPELRSEMARLMTD